MNVDDVDTQEVTEDRLEMIFARQKDLSDKYLSVEESNGIGLLAIAGPGPYSLDNPKFQYVLKDYAWRATEEVAESLDSYHNEDNKTHQQEELADALHFLVELSLHVGITALDVAEFSQKIYSTFMVKIKCNDHLDTLYQTSICDALDRSMEVAVSDFIMYLGCAMNCLKNKPWKLTHMETDAELFKKNIMFALMYLMEISFHADMTATTIFELYFKKSEVNKFRIRSNY